MTYEDWIWSACAGIGIGVIVMLYIEIRDLRWWVEWHKNTAQHYEGLWDTHVLNLLKPASKKTKAKK